MEIVSQTTKNSLKEQKCSFSGDAADYYIGLSGTNNSNSKVRIVGAIHRDLVETAINQLLGKGSDELKWPVILDLKKKILFHSHEAHQNGTSAILGWQEYFSKVS
ncbi:MAG: hypothetical protein AB8B59_04045 [Maribacter sp.]